MKNKWKNLKHFFINFKGDEIFLLNILGIVFFYASILITIIGFFFYLLNPKMKAVFIILLLQITWHSASQIDSITQRINDFALRLYIKLAANKSSLISKSFYFVYKFNLVTF